MYNNDVLSSLENKLHVQSTSMGDRGQFRGLYVQFLLADTVPIDRRPLRKVTLLWFDIKLYPKL
jgi:hypothetical protein